MKYNIFNRTLLAAALAAVCAVTFIACEKQQPVAPESEPDIIFGNQSSAGIPLVLRNKWIYRETILDQNGAIINTRTYTNEIVREFKVGTQHWFVSRITVGQTSTETYVANINGAQYYRNSVDSLSFLYLNYPSSSSQSFNMDVVVPGLNGIPDSVVHVPCTISPVPTIVRVPLGRFFAFQYTTAQVSVPFGSGTLSIDASELYLSDIGLVRDVHYSNFQGKQYVSLIHELIEFTIRM
jgi:hypothetical protein